MENFEVKLMEYCCETEIDGVKCVYCGTKFDCRTSFQSHVFGVNGFMECYKVPDNLKAHFLAAAKRSCVLVCLTVTVRNGKYLAYVVWSPDGLFIHDVWSADIPDPGNSLLHRKMWNLFNGTVDPENLVLCLSDTDLKPFVSNMVFKGKSFNWVSSGKCPFGDLLKTICSEFKKFGPVLQWGSLLFYFLVKYQGFKLYQDIHPFFVPKDLMWDKDYPCPRDVFDELLSQFSALCELVNKEHFVRSTAEFKQQILNCDSIFKRMLTSKVFWETAKSVVEFGEPLFEILSRISRGSTAAEFFISIFRAESSISQSGRFKHVKKQLQKLMERPIYKASAFLHPRFEGVPLNEASLFFSNLVESVDKKTILLEIQTFGARNTEMFAINIHPDHWWIANQKHFPTLVVVDNKWFQKRYLVAGGRLVTYGVEEYSAFFANCGKLFDRVCNLRGDVVSAIHKGYNFVFDSPIDLPVLDDSLEDHPIIGE